MAVANNRSMGNELLEGATDGTVRKMFQERSGIVDPINAYNHVHSSGWPPVFGDAFKAALMHGVVRPHTQVLSGDFDSGDASS